MLRRSFKAYRDETLALKIQYFSGDGRGQDIQGVADIFVAPFLSDNIGFEFNESSHTFIHKRCE